MKKLALALLVSACSQTGLTVDVSENADVPPLDTLQVQVSQGALLVTQSFALGDKKLPQSIAIISKGMTTGSVDVSVQGLENDVVMAVGKGKGDLAPAGNAVHVALTLARFCTGNATCTCTAKKCDGRVKACGMIDDGCGAHVDCGTCAVSTDTCVANVCTPQVCTKKTCAQQGAQCGQVSDGCMGLLDCGGCDAGTCGANNMPNRCGTGVCTPYTACAVDMTCGAISDGCSGMVTCGVCDGGTSTCGGGGNPFQCGCTKATTCPQGKECGQWPDGCGGMIPCGICDAGTCGGGGQQNVCGCTPLLACPAGACGPTPDGCGNALNCSPFCGNTKTCLTPGDGGSGRCQCNNGLIDCNGVCTSLGTDSSNCGACGNTCPGAQACTDGLCPCVDAGSNSDGHCCPAGWTMSFHFNQSIYPRCFLGPFDAGTEQEGVATCYQATQRDFGYGISALGVGGQETLPANGLPAGACGSFWFGPEQPTRVMATQMSGTFTSLTTANCEAACLSTPCTCDTCNCNSPFGCEQPFYCVMDPLGPRVEGGCAISGDCPPGRVCAGNHCLATGHAPCTLDSDCYDAGYTTCTGRSGSQTGICN